MQAAETRLVSESLPEEFYNSMMDKENITDDWVLLNTPFPVVGILLVYFLFLRLGSQIMKYRDPFEMKTSMRLHNLFQVIHNGFIFFSIIRNPGALPCVIKLSCTVEDHGVYDDLKYIYLYYSWHYMVSKYFDLLDTIFMVLRKKNSHITFLHVYHHSAMVFFVWLNLRYTKSLHSVIPAVINTAVHTIMYGYYFLATFPGFKKHLWWKRHLTKLQLGQFVFDLLYILLLYYYGCPISRVFTYTWVINVSVILGLFINFYIKTYIRKSATSIQQPVHSKTF